MTKTANNGIKLNVLKKKRFRTNPNLFSEKNNLKLKFLMRIV
jgi:hypothetical protein